MPGAADDPFDLQRFVDAQDGVFEDALAELTAGRKRTHWMWFVFPQLRGLGHSAMAHRYGVASLEEARAYVAHPVLGARLAKVAQVAADSDAASLKALFGAVDALKFVSSMTLFRHAAGPDSVFQAALERWNETPDPRTEALLR